MDPTVVLGPKKKYGELSHQMGHICNFLRNLKNIEFSRKFLLLE
jgi:hypothetical protein